MNRIIAAIMCLVALAAHPAWADVTGARVVSIGEMGKTSPVAGAQTDITGGPGIRFGMELVPEGTPQGAPVVLEARLKRPDDPQDAPPMRWMVAARIGIPVLSVWEFAYDWEVEPGLWTMTVSYEDAVLATASFMVVQPDPQAQASLKPVDTRQDKKASDTASAKSQTPPPASLPKPGDAKASTGKLPESSKPESSKADTAKTEAPKPAAAKPDTDKTEAARQDPAKADQQKPAAPRQDVGPSVPQKQPVTDKSAPPPQKDRPAKPLAEVQGPGASQDKSGSRELAGASGKRVQVLVAGVYSEEARALWVAAFLRKSGVKACVRMEDRGGKKRWSLVAGWRDTPEEARRAKEELTPTVGEIVIVPMSASDLEKGLQCR